MKKIIILLLVFIVSPLAAQQWSYNTLDNNLISSNVASIGNKIIFYSGAKYVGTSQLLSDEIEIFDVTSNTKQVFTAPSGASRFSAASAVSNHKVFFAGGYGSTGETTRVDIYDTLTGSWTTAELSAKRRDLAGTATATKVFFGGGFGNSTYSRVVDIYNSATNTWTATEFPNATQPPQRTDLAAATVNNKVFFAGGAANSYRDLTSVYDATTSSWLPNTMISQTKKSMTSIFYKKKIYFIGGTVRNNITAVLSPSDTIDIYDGTTDNWSTLKIPRLMYRGNGAKRMYNQAVVAGCKIFIAPENNIYSGGATLGNPDTIAVYDLARDSWSYLALPHPRSGIILAAAQNKVYFAGGGNATAPFSALNHIDIYSVLPKLQLAVESTPVEEQAYHFGNILINDQANALLNISNEGDYDLLFKDTPNKWTITGDINDFTLDLSTLHDIDTLEPAQVFNIPISFHPTTAGEKSLTVTFYSNDPDLPEYSFILNGNATVLNSNEKNSTAHAINIYPVPCTDLLNIHINTPFQNASLRMTDLHGKVIKVLDDIKSITQLSTVSFPNGMYFLQFTINDQSYLQKVAVLH